VTNIPIPPPNEPIASTDGRLNDVWYRYFEDGSRGLNSASSAVAAATTATTFAKTILATTTASAARTVLDVDRASSVSAVVATTGTTAISLTTAIPTGAQRVSVLFDGVTHTSTTAFYVQLGTTSGLVATGYIGSCLLLTSGAQAGFHTTIGFPVYVNSAARPVYGEMTLTRLTSHQWTGSLAAGVVEASVGQGLLGGGISVLGAELERVSIVTTSTGVFNAGQASVHWDF
jgi:hypothetical protein